jgi:hypothetical protein
MTFEDTFKPLLDQPPSKVDPRDLDRAVTAFDDHVTGTQDQIEQMERDIVAKREALADARRNREMYANYRAIVLHLRGLPAAEAAATAAVATTEPDDGRARSRRGAKHGAILEYLSDGAARHKNEIREALIAEGIMGETAGESHTLNVTLSRMYRNDELERPRVGVYKLPSPDSGAVSSGEDDGERS